MFVRKKSYRLSSTPLGLRFVCLIFCNSMSRDSLLDNSTNIFTKYVELMFALDLRVVLAQVDTLASAPDFMRFLGPPLY